MGATTPPIMPQTDEHIHYKRVKHTLMLNRDNNTLLFATKNGQKVIGNSAYQSRSSGAFPLVLPLEHEGQRAPVLLEPHRVRHGAVAAPVPPAHRYNHNLHCNLTMKTYGTLYLAI